MRYNIVRNSAKKSKRADLLVKRALDTSLQPHWQVECDEVVGVVVIKASPMEISEGS